MTEWLIKSPGGARRRLALGVILLGAGLLIALSGSAENNDYVVHPIWMRRPWPGDLQRLYPKGVRAITADVRADCTVDDKGALATCDIVSENPPGLGFGESTIKLSKLFRMKAIDRDGVPVAGRKLQLPVRWGAEFSQ